MHKSSFQSMEKFKNNYLNPEDSLNILDIGSYDASDTSYNYGRFLREDNWKISGHGYSRRSKCRYCCFRYL